MRPFIAMTLMMASMIGSLAVAELAEHEVNPSAEAKYMLLTQDQLVAHCLAAVDIQVGASDYFQVTLALVAKHISQTANGTGCCGQNDWVVNLPGFENFDFARFIDSDWVNVDQVSEAIGPYMEKYIDGFQRSGPNKSGMETIEYAHDADSEQQFQRFLESGKRAFNLELYLRTTVRVKEGSEARGNLLFSIKSDDIERLPNAVIATPIPGDEFWLSKSEENIYKVSKDFSCVKSVSIYGL